MSKYDPLGVHLEMNGTEFVPMTFAEIEHVIGASLPDSKSYPAWWSNNPTNNVMTKVWLGAGYRTEQVDIAGQKLVFKRDQSAAKPIPPGGGDGTGPTKADRKRHPLFGWLKDKITIVSGTDLTEPADPDWGERLNESK